MEKSKISDNRKKTSYQTTSLSIPQPLKEHIEKLTNYYKCSVDKECDRIFMDRFNEFLESLSIFEELPPKQVESVETSVETNINQSNPIEANKSKENTPPQKVILTASQQQAFQQLTNFLKTGTTNKFFRLTGYAGTGKSFLIVKFLEYCRQKKLEFVAAAPTNKASKNLAKIAYANGLNINCSTIAQLLGQQPQMNQESGKEEFISLLEVDLSSYDLIICDEFSMISTANFEEIKKAVYPLKNKVIFVGDAAQLPPVGEQEPIIAITPEIKQEATLTEIVRYEGEIGKVAEEIRSNPRYQRYLYPFKTLTDQSIICLNYEQWLATAGNYFKSKEYQNNSDFCRILVWRNKTADSLNDWVREQLWGKNAPPYVIGDRLIAKKPVFRKLELSSDKNKWIIKMNNSEECEIVERPYLKTENNLEYWVLKVITDYQSDLTLRILTPESEEKRQKMLQDYKEKKQWQQFYNLDRYYDYCPFAYTLTTHKAQGSGIDHVFINTFDMRGCPDLQKIQYTALTRAKIRAYMPTS